MKTASAELKRRLFAVDEYHRMAEVGILDPDERVELIDGEIVEMSSIGLRHARCLMFLTDLFVRRLDGRALLSPQLPLRLHRRSEPQPDLMLLKPPLSQYATTLAGPEHVLLVVEISDTSQYRDRVVELPRYAAAGLPEYWIVDLKADAVDVYREPTADRYRTARRIVRGGTVAPAAFSGHRHLG